MTQVEACAVRGAGGQLGLLEAFTIIGPGDLWCRVVARSNTDLQRVIDRVLAHEGIVRCSSVIALATQLPCRVLPLLGSVTG